jgi:methionyl-tRNA formyltransferase
MEANHYVVATVKSWNVKAFALHTLQLPGNWHLIQSQEELTLDYLQKIKPRYIFFPHWSWIVPIEITKQYECVCFHMTDVPYGQGGSPLQNLIVRGHTKTKLSALKMQSELDAGPVYIKTDLSLQGSATNIFERAADLVYDLIAIVIEQELKPVDQEGDVTLFQRRTPSQSRVLLSASIEQIHDQVRMLDAESYPHAFIEYGDFRLEFTDSKIVGNELECRVNIKKVNNVD